MCCFGGLERGGVDSVMNGACWLPDWVCWPAESEEVESSYQCEDERGHGSFGDSVGSAVLAPGLNFGADLTICTTGRGSRSFQLGRELSLIIRESIYNGMLSNDGILLMCVWLDKAIDENLNYLMFAHFHELGCFLFMWIVQDVINFI